MSSFFTLPKSQRKRKRTDTGNTSTSKKQKSRNTGESKTRTSSARAQRDESISGSESDEDDDEPRRGDTLEDDIGDLGSDEDVQGETAGERRLRLAERYLDHIREEVDETGFDAEQIDRDLIAERFKEDVAESKGKLYRHIAQKLSLEDASRTMFRADTHPTTSIAMCSPYVYTVSKDRTLIKWEIASLSNLNHADANTEAGGEKVENIVNPGAPLRRRPKQVAFVRGKGKSNKKDINYVGHVDQILTVAASEDGRFVVTGGRDGRLIVWNAVDLTPLRMFTQHREAITSLAFRKGSTNQLYSGSRDRTIKLWSLNELAYVETLFGHQDEVVDLAALAQERCVSVGARDRSARLWKVVEETQLVFRGGAGRTGTISSSEMANKGNPSNNNKHGRNIISSYAEGSMDCIAMIDEETFVTGSDNGSISLWTLQKKKPLFTIPLAHGLDPPLPPEEASAETNPSSEKVGNSPPQPRWITALATVPYSDLILSGSWDGRIRAWKVSSDKKSLEAMGVVGADGGIERGGPQLEAQDVNGKKGYVPGIVNGIVIVERGERGKEGICVAVATGKEHRLGRWKKMKQGKNGAVMFEIGMKTARISTSGGDGDGDGNGVPASSVALHLSSPDGNDSHDEQRQTGQNGVYDNVAKEADTVEEKTTNGDAA
ncbi:MAG: hypothetical protein M1823_003927 [Watsoniomyces obsoletus]|nr:MAG: hypothetical protein M1823_003927 [Watsoniomyces obsoletus]